MAGGGSFGVYSLRTTSAAYSSLLTQGQHDGDAEMATQSSQVSDTIHSIASVAEEQNASTEELSAAAEEMSAQVEEMSAQAEEVATTAEELKRLVSRFHRDRDGLLASQPAVLRRAA